MNTAIEIRKITEASSKELNNELTIPLIEGLITVTATLGFNKIIVSIFPDMLETLKEYFVGYNLLDTTVREKGNMDKIVLMISW